MSKGTSDPDFDRSVGTGRADIGALLISLLLFASSFGVAAAEDDDGQNASGAAPSQSVSASEASPPGVDGIELTVAPEARGDDYDRDLFEHWIDADGNGCDTRQEVLVTEATGDTESDSGDTCRIISGEWLSLYDGVVVTDPSLLDIDHMVPLKEAWESTASSWTSDEREAYANDLDEPWALLAVTASTNRSKSDRDPALWKPPDEGSWCDYARAWIRVKTKWSLNADEAEVAALGEMLATC